MEGDPGPPGGPGVRTRQEAGQGEAEDDGTEARPDVVRRISEQCVRGQRQQQGGGAGQERGGPQPDLRGAPVPGGAAAEEPRQCGPVCQ